jgi:hypothetical protein
MLQTATSPRRLGRSAGALVLGFLAVVVLSTATDQLMHALAIYPPWGEPMYEPSLNILALAYRSVYAVLGSYIAARFAPRAPMAHALILGGVGFVLSLLGAVAAISYPKDLGPLWYPVVLVLTTLPCAWLGGILYRVQGLKDDHDS